MSSANLTIRVTDLPRGELATLRKQAKTLGVSAETYARDLISAGISLERQARTTTFDELYASVRARFRESGMTMHELDELVDAARARHHRRTSRKKR